DVVVVFAVAECVSRCFAVGGATLAAAVGAGAFTASGSEPAGFSPIAAASFDVDLAVGAGFSALADLGSAEGGTGTGRAVNLLESGGGILMLISPSMGLGSVSSTMGSTTTMAVTNTMAPIRRRLARRLSCNSSSLIGLAMP